MTAQTKCCTTCGDAGTIPMAGGRTAPCPEAGCCSNRADTSADIDSAWALVRECDKNAKASADAIVKAERELELARLDCHRRTSELRVAKSSLARRLAKSAQAAREKPLIEALELAHRILNRDGIQALRGEAWTDDEHEQIELAINSATRSEP